MMNELKNIQNLNKEDLIKILLEYKAKEQDFKLQNEIFKDLIKNYAKVSNELKVTIKEVTALSVTDPLTKIYNRIKFHEELDRQIKKYKRHRLPFSVIMFDIDHFKNINDTYGHDVGDLVLKTLCKIVTETIRETDVFARWGGEEFILLATDDTLERAINLAQRLRENIETYSFEQVEHITCSFGVTEFSAEDIEDSFTKRVDEALYLAKNQGRNRVVNL